ncbi:DUF397 domain-containing protein [Nonomuraea sp. NPDC052116]|uniref:DUF397 domain-containing protein n=1 Tax=Nonomuraea sp. NPDC052116 TaxID=3155665 RepID=UPI00341B0A23
MSRPVWRKSSSDADATGVEVAVIEGVVTVRDAARPYEAVLVFDPERWAAFTAGVREGDFDLEALTCSAGDGSGVDAACVAPGSTLAGL